MDKKKAEWERLIAENGGELVSLAGRRTAYIISRKVCSAEGTGVVCRTFVNISRDTY